MLKRPAEGNDEEAQHVKMFSVSYETLVKAFIGCLLALMAWSYNEITSLRQNKADKAEVYREVAALHISLKRIADGVKRVEDLHLNGKSAPKAP